MTTGLSDFIILPQPADYGVIQDTLLPEILQPGERQPKLTPTFLMSVLARGFRNRFTTACVGVGVGVLVTTVLVVVACAEVDDCGAGLTVVATRSTYSVSYHSLESSRES